MDKVNFYIDTVCGNTDGFDSGFSVFNEYLTAPFDSAVIHYIMDIESDRLIAYFSLLSSALMDGEPAKLNIAPAIEIKMFAIDKNYQGTGLASVLFDSAISMVQHYATSSIGADLVILYSVPVAHVVELYKRCGFHRIEGPFTAFRSPFTEGCVPMYKVL